MPDGTGTEGTPRTVSVSAPGKLHLLGEYAVLAGAPALLMAVDRRVSVVLTESDSGWSLTAPELGVDKLALGEHGGLPDGLDNCLHHRLTLVDSVRREVDELAPSTGGLNIDIESSQFLHHGDKLGLGSSAAVAVALTAAFAASRGVQLTPAELFARAARAHSAAQGGKGSGADIATTVHGGHILFRQGSEPHRVSWPHDLALFAVVTGTGSSTVDLVARVADYGARDHEGYLRDLSRLCSLAESIDKALADTDTFLALADEYFLGIEAFDAHAGAGIVTERHRALRLLAAGSGGVFKTSGAGGGDLGLVFAKLESTDQLQSVFTEAGATVIPVPFSRDGVRRESS
ncbi:MAG: hypothetical protein ABI238_06655 [Terrimesophilobacter sp.]